MSQFIKILFGNRHAPQGKPDEVPMSAPEKAKKPIPHPKPWQSACWPHVELIRERRLARASWPEIAEELRGLGVNMTPQAIGRFFKRSKKQKRPLGWDQEVAPEPRASAQPKAQPARRITASELLTPISKVSASPFAEWEEQNTSAKNGS